MIPRSLLTGLAAAVLFLATAAVAAPPVTGPCAADAQRFCPDVANRRQALECLRTHKHELSRDCAWRVDAARALVKYGRKACQADIDKFCKGVDPGAGRLRDCLKTHVAELSPDCKQAIDRPRRTRGDARPRHTPGAGETATPATTGTPATEETPAETSTPAATGAEAGGGE